MKIHPVGAELLHMGGWADTTKLTVAFRNFANAPKTNKLMLNREIITVRSKNKKKKHINVLLRRMWNL
jgi:hypothetical protein